MKKRSFTLHVLAPLVSVTMLITACTQDGGVNVPQPPIDKKNAPGAYAVRISAGEKSAGDATRAVWDGVNYYWSPGDCVGLVMIPGSGGDHIAHNVCMRGEHQAQCLNSSFSGEFSEQQMNAVSPSGTYDYYSYFPHQEDVGEASAFPNIQFDIPADMTLRKNEFNCRYAPMVGFCNSADCSHGGSSPHPNTGLHPIAWLEDGALHYGETICFSYRHVMSYVALSMSLNLMSSPVTRIEITNTGGAALAGKLNVNLSDGSCSWGAGTNVLTLNIEGGIEVGDVVYFPILPGNLRSQDFDFRFYTASGQFAEVKEIKGRNFTKGHVHNLRLAVPFHLDFNDAPDFAYGAAGEFSRLGYTFWGNERAWIEEGGLRLGYMQSGPNGMIRFPAIDITNTRGMTSIPVIFSVFGISNGKGKTSDAKVSVVSVDATSHGIITELSMPGKLDEAELKKITLSSSAPCIMMESNFGSGSDNYYDIREIWIKPDL